MGGRLKDYLLVCICTTSLSCRMFLPSQKESYVIISKWEMIKIKKKRKCGVLGVQSIIGRTSWVAMLACHPEMCESNNLWYKFWLCMTQLFRFEPKWCSTMEAMVIIFILELPLRRTRIYEYERAEVWTLKGGCKKGGGRTWC